MTKLSTPIQHFKKEAKNLFKQVKANNAEAKERVLRVLKDPVDISLMRVQHVIAVEYGFSKWEDLIKASAVELCSAIAKNKANHNSRVPSSKPTGTPLGNFFRGPGILPTPPHYAALADMFDSMTREEQIRYLDEDARRMGFFRRS